MNVFLFAFVKQEGKLAFTDDFGHGTYRAEITGGECGQRVYIVLVFSVVEAGNDIARHIDQENTVNPDIHKIRLENVVYAVKLFLAERV